MKTNPKRPDVFGDMRLMTETAQPQMIAKPLDIPAERARELAINLFKEEGIKEYLGALIKWKENPTQELLTEVFDGALDTIVVVCWMMRVANLPMEAGWNEVQRSNMSKFPLVSDWPVPPRLMDLPEYKTITVEYKQVGTPARWVLLNADTGKFLKPECYSPPDLKAILEEHRIMTRVRNQPDSIGDSFYREYFDNIQGLIENGKLG